MFQGASNILTSILLTLMTPILDQDGKFDNNPRFIEIVVTPKEGVQLAENDSQGLKGKNAILISRIRGSGISLYRVELTHFQSKIDLLSILREQNPHLWIAENSVTTIDTNLRQPAVDFHPSQWPLKNFGPFYQHSQIGVLDSDIDGIEAISQQLALIDPNIPRAKVAVIDTGVNIYHPALVNQIWRNKGEIARNGIDDDLNGYVDDLNGWNTADDHWQVLDENGHGTHVSGIIAAKGQVRGLATHAEIIPIKVVKRGDANGGVDFYAVLAALKYAQIVDADVINISLGFKNPSQEQIKIFELALAPFEENTILVSSAGNDGRNLKLDPYMPCTNHLVICVANLNRSGRLSPDSNFSPNAVDIAAPGTEILSTYGHGYKVLSGTSMASPHVAATAAILKSMRPQEGAGEIFLRLMDGADRPPYLRDKIIFSRRLNTYNAMFSNHVSEAEYCSIERKINKPFANSGEPGINGWSEEAAFTICSAEQFLRLNQSGRQFFELKSDIDFSQVVVPNFRPIPFFGGILEGNGHTLFNPIFLSTNYPSNDAALFQKTSVTTVIRNLRIVGGVFKGKRAAALVVESSGGSFTNIHVEAAVEGDVAGGLIATQHYSPSFPEGNPNVYGVTFEGFVSGRIAGGIIGVGSGVIENSHVSVSLVDGNISYSDQPRFGGGVFGRSSGRYRDVRISETIAEVFISDEGGFTTSGGLIGHARCNAEIVDSYSIGKIGKVEAFGGLIGFAQNVSINRSFADHQFSDYTKRNDRFIFSIDDYETGGGGTRGKFDCGGDRPAPPSKILVSFFHAPHSNPPGRIALPLSKYDFRDRSNFPNWFNQGSGWQFTQEYGPIIRHIPRMNGFYEVSREKP